MGKHGDTTVTSKFATGKIIPEVLGQKTTNQTKMLEPHRELNKSKTCSEKQREGEGEEKDSLGPMLGYNAHLTYVCYISLDAKLSSGKARGLY